MAPRLPGFGSAFGTPGDSRTRLSRTRSAGRGASLTMTLPAEREDLYADVSNLKKTFIPFLDRCEFLVEIARICIPGASK